MAHMFQQMYVDEIDFASMSRKELIELVFTKIVHQGMKQLEEGDVDLTDRRIYLEVMVERNLRHNFIVEPEAVGNIQP